MTTLTQQALSKLAGIFAREVPFNRVLGLEFQTLDPEKCVLSFKMKDELVGNFVTGVLHGGVISAALDMAGGTMAAVSVMHANPITHITELGRKLARLSTIDIRVDYLQPGRGEVYFATATMLRTGSRVAVVRMELRNETDTLIAVATGTYMVA